MWNGFTSTTSPSQGHDVERIYLHNKSIKGCLGCGKCRENPDEIACVQDDDAENVLEQMIQSDVVLFASPVYFWGFSAQLKALIDRSFSLVTNYHQPNQTSLLKGKRVGLLVTGAGTYENNAGGLFTAFGRIADFFLAKKSGELYVGECSVPAEMPETAKIKAAKLARSLVA